MVMFCINGAGVVNTSVPDSLFPGTTKTQKEEIMSSLKVNSARTEVTNHWQLRQSHATNFLSAIAFVCLFSLQLWGQQSSQMVGIPLAKTQRTTTMSAMMI